MSNPTDLFNQAKSAATTVASTVVNTATSAVNQATALAGQAANSDAAANVTSSARSLGSQAASTAGSLAGQAHAQAHALAPTVIPAPAGGATAEGVDNRGDLSPTDEVGKAKFEKLFESRHTANELKDKGILKGAPGDSLAGKRADLEKAMHKDQLDKDIAQRPQPEELVKKGILNPDEAPPAQ
ncbi:hypothetical protein I302_105013 [Kwoniella bestiolae CBS 10118]|uniref:Uncharacterized protein n=1 Tax=Kwoniella bestiolae CBS 10118 TaxID=1296100 RepID=A0A1B9FR69_9TREE|nr:hypothetical protein I302_08914 [Kwoniella bestiolae CBS 10118]OCF21242.1 hypothetical protein I302_08914 [Kwoniella bestiolae CBS 10118]